MRKPTNMLKSAALMEEKKKNKKKTTKKIPLPHRPTDLNQEKLGQSLLFYQSKCRINSFILGARALRLLVALPPSTGDWECHHSTEGFRTRPGARRTSTSMSKHVTRGQASSHRFTLYLSLTIHRRGLSLLRDHKVHFYFLLAVKSFHQIQTAFGCSIFSLESWHT